MEKTNKPVRKTRQRLQKVHRGWANKHHIKRHSTALVRENAELKKTRVTIFFSIRLANSLKVRVLGNVKIHCWWEWKLAQCFWKAIWQYVIKIESGPATHLWVSTCTQGGPYWYVHWSSVLLKNKTTLNIHQGSGEINQDPSKLWNSLNRNSKKNKVDFPCRKISKMLPSEESNWPNDMDSMILFTWKW